MKAIWLFMFLTLCLPYLRKSNNDSPSGLMVEFIREPDRVRILDSKPEFSWIVPEEHKRIPDYHTGKYGM